VFPEALRSRHRRGARSRDRHGIAASRAALTPSAAIRLPATAGRFVCVRLTRWHVPLTIVPRTPVRRCWSAAMPTVVDLYVLALRSARISILSVERRRRGASADSRSLGVGRDCRRRNSCSRLGCLPPAAGAAAGWGPAHCADRMGLTLTLASRRLR
jgi:hypothetical protein